MDEPDEDQMEATMTHEQLDKIIEQTIPATAHTVSEQPNVAAAQQSQEQEKEQ